MTDLHDDYAVLRIPFSEEELERIERAAEAEGISVEEWLRVQLLRAVRQEPLQDEQGA